MDEYDEVQETWEDFPAKGFNLLPFAMHFTGLVLRAPIRYSSKTSFVLVEIHLEHRENETKHKNIKN